MALEDALRDVNAVIETAGDALWEILQREVVVPYDETLAKDSLEGFVERFGMRPTRMADQIIKQAVEHMKDQAEDCARAILNEL